MLPKYFLIALAEIGTEEISGKAANKRIIEYFQSCNNKLHISDDAVPWCAAFVGWCINKSGGIGTHSLLARSYIHWGGKAKGRMGDVVILKRGREPWMGHVGFLVKKTKRYVYVLGGNQNNQVKISRYLRSDVLDYRTN